jgi:glycosyltransferase involved in cell wall biosynthesis
MSRDARRAPTLTVVVPTRDRPSRLSTCLEALAAQRLDGRLEIVVADDHSREVDAVARAVERVHGARLVRIQGHGVAAARNEGVRAACSRFVCFTDDDCEPDPDWAARLLEQLHAGAAVVAGQTVNGHRRSRLAAASQIVSNAFASESPVMMAPASNVACRRDLALAVAFDEGYAGIGAEDRDWYARVAAAGYELLFEPEATVRHRPSNSLGAFLRRHVRYGRGAYRFRRNHRDGRLERPGFYARLLRRGFDEGFATGFGVCLAQAATALGFALEAVAERKKEGAVRRAT